MAEGLGLVEGDGVAAGDGQPAAREAQANLAVLQLAAARRAPLGRQGAAALARRPGDQSRIASSLDAAYGGAAEHLLEEDDVRPLARLSQGGEASADLAQVARAATSRRPAQAFDVVGRDVEAQARRLPVG